MRLYNFTGTQTSFEIRLDDDIEVSYCDFTVKPDYVKIHSIEFVNEDDRSMVNLELLAKTMYEYIDWSEMEQEAFDYSNQMREDEMMDN